MSDTSLLPCAVLGSPISHSLSPAMHRAFYAHLGQPDRRFDAIDVGAAEFAGFWSSVDAEQWAGFSVTMPLKSLVAQAADEIHGYAAEIMVANTVVFHDGRAHAHNTDVTGLRQIVTTRLPEASTAVVIGSGDTAASALLALRDSGVPSAIVLARRLEGVESLRRRVTGIAISGFRLGADGAADFGDVDVVVSTVPADAADEVIRDLPPHMAPRLLIDLSYGGRGIAAAFDGRIAAGAMDVVDGRECLVQQGVEQVLLHLGLIPLVEEAPGAGVGHLRDELVIVGRKAIGIPS